jgi:hypothetical protein
VVDQIDDGDSVACQLIVAVVAPVAGHDRLRVHRECGGGQERVARIVDDISGNVVDVLDVAVREAVRTNPQAAAT